MFTELGLGIKYTFVGKIGALLVGGAPVLFAVELTSHINALIAAIPPTAAVILGVVALRKGQKTMMINIDGRMEQLLKQTAKASVMEGKELERGEARERRDEIRVELRTAELNKGPDEVTVVNTARDPANVKVGNLPTEPVPTTTAEKKEEIKKLSQEIREEQNR